MEIENNIKNRLTIIRGGKEKKEREKDDVNEAQERIWTCGTKCQRKQVNLNKLHKVTTGT